ncbi:hypothetical protein CSAL01_05999 [Colletotrichum salicis]|uniref:Uncharacterized protein n=1 Tax=Colletotrichum salicis TaxID=1209931 RepID=A0A135V8Z8_9PEZI|nr:hypothetical protein CSAL01_05999 [Colletotrichum salicis]
MTDDQGIISEKGKKHMGIEKVDWEGVGKSASTTGPLQLAAANAMNSRSRIDAAEVISSWRVGPRMHMQAVVRHLAPAPRECRPAAMDCIKKEAGSNEPHIQVSTGKKHKMEEAGSLQAEVLWYLRNVTEPNEQPHQPSHHIHIAGTDTAYEYRASPLHRPSFLSGSASDWGRWDSPPNDPSSLKFETLFCFLAGFPKMATPAAISTALASSVPSAACFCQIYAMESTVSDGFHLLEIAPWQ